MSQQSPSVDSDEFFSSTLQGVGWRKSFDYTRAAVDDFGEDDDKKRLFRLEYMADRTYGGDGSAAFEIGDAQKSDSTRMSREYSPNTELLCFLLPASSGEEDIFDETSRFASGDRADPDSDSGCLEQGYCVDDDDNDILLVDS